MSRSQDVRHAALEIRKVAEGLTADELAEAFMDAFDELYPDGSEDESADDALAALHAFSDPDNQDTEDE